MRRRPNVPQLPAQLTGRFDHGYPMAGNGSGTRRLDATRPAADDEHMSRVRGRK